LKVVQSSFERLNLSFSFFLLLLKMNVR